MVQQILSCCESIDSDLSVFLNSSEEHYYIYLGVALLEKISIDPADLRHKMLMGRLYNGGARLSILQKRFNHDPRTIKNWACALLSNNTEEMIRAFSGRSGNMKATPELARYVRQQYRQRALLGKNYRQVIIRNTEEVFGVRISESLASALFVNDKGDGNDEGSEQEDSQSNMLTPGHSKSHSSLTDTPTVQTSPCFPFMAYTQPQMGKTLIQHAGLVLFGYALNGYDPFQKQLICQLLQGALNIEQSKSLCSDSLRFFNEKVVSVLRSQRKLLDQQATEENILNIYHQNNKLLSDGPDKGTVFYFDPHTKKYTGQLKTMKGWCGSAHSVSKVVNLDSFHTESGRPCYIRHYSPFYDMRERFFMSLSLFDQLFEEGKRRGRTFIIDRAIYGAECFLRFTDDYLITWEKGYTGDGWNEAAKTVEFSRAKQKNSKRSKRLYHFKCQEELWSKNSSFRRIIVKATNYKGTTITVSVLCSNPHMSIEDAVWLICNRWLQENDFKFLDQHFGINQLDSRQHFSFEEEADNFADREVNSLQYKEVKKLLYAAERSLAKHLLKINKAEKRQLSLAVEKLNIPIETKVPPALKGKITRNEKQLAELNAQKTELELKLEQAETNQIEALRKESRKQQLIDGSYQLLNTRRKAYMDALRVNAANIFRNLHEQYRVLYDDYRDDHFYLRLLTRASGILSYGENTSIRLWLPGSLQPRTVNALKSLVSTVQDEINESRPSDCKELKIELLTGTIMT
jgi:hypothetical protein